MAITSQDLPETLLIFPLPGAILLPRARLPLHIFEPRYLAMLEACMATPTRLIGMIQPRGRDDRQGAELCAVGCAGRVTSFSETNDGRYMITLQGVSRFTLREEQASDTPYRIIRPDWAGFERDLAPHEADASFDRPAFITLFTRYLSAMQMGADVASLSDAEDEMLINALSMICPFGPEERQALLEAPDLTARRQTLETLFEFALRSAPNGKQEPVQ